MYKRIFPIFFRKNGKYPEKIKINKEEFDLSKHLLITAIGVDITIGAFFFFILSKSKYFYYIAVAMQRDWPAQYLHKMCRRLDNRTYQCRVRIVSS
ncbi:Hypothetical protein PSM36_1908 [Proteiniphilum saccharofermentans]|uniref:Uncharacterized protein n=1 Tax=Proteiniphilum saccharofermentans TaxID=1642647 RepID=A0A1R3TAV1_9BACT|nr:Hypothetical protein PSM36_1908 [Proteiniphilum saccharofermentans]SEA49180.1 hypothetical protein SAMN05216331_1647 [Porphyromonadaceae bacterium KH3R12]